MTVRLRLTLVYGALFLACGVALLGITYVLARHEYTGKFFISSGTASVIGANGGVQTVQMGPGDVGLGPEPADVVAAAQAQSAAALHKLLVDSAIALAVMSVLSIALGWLIAGRALRPLRTITEAARDISASDLHRRLALVGPQDEVKQLGDTFDGLLGRLETAFDAQRQFVANASHELRTPLTYERALLEVALADPNASVESLRHACGQALVAGEQQERLIEALLTLSRSQRGLDRYEPVDLSAVAAEAAASVDRGDRTLDLSLEPARTSGDARLVERLVANLVSNAVRHNVAGGNVSVETHVQDGSALLAVRNTGPALADGELPRLFRPFERRDSDGLGLGLSIVDAIATAHAAKLTARPRRGGGLVVEVAFPAA